MRILGSMILACVLAACSGPTKPAAEPGATIGSDSASETCCCKWNPITAEDAKPAYEDSNRMECSSKQGECVPDVQCKPVDAPAE